MAEPEYKNQPDWCKEALARTPPGGVVWGSGLPGYVGPQYAPLVDRKIYPEDERRTCEWLLKKRANGSVGNDAGIEARKKYLPQVASADDFAKVEPGRAFVTVNDGMIRWKPV